MMRLTPESAAGGETKLARSETVTRLLTCFCIGLLWMLCACAAWGQAMSGALSGTVADVDGAVIPKAEVTLENSETHDIRKTTADTAGYFHFAAIPRGTYSVTITANGFTPWKNENIVFNQGENHSLPNIAMRVAGAGEQMTIVSSVAGLVPVDTGESRTTLNTKMVENISIVGRNASELIKLMPGMAMNNGLSQQAYSSLVTSTGGGPTGQYSASGGQPYGGLQVTSDGANIVDPGNQGSSVANINQDQTAEVTYLNSAFGADTAKGPTVFQATSKGGTSQYHGSAYLYTRQGFLNSLDAFNKAQYVEQNKPVVRPNDKYYYPGGTLGGPVPFVTKNKLFFFGAYEYMTQQPDGTLHNVTVPTDQMRNGNFSSDVMAPFSSLGGGVNQVPCNSTLASQWYYNNYCGTAQGQAEVAGGQISTTAFDPNSLALINLMPRPNIDPGPSGGYNYQFKDTVPTDRWEARGRIDWNITDKTKFYIIYTRQHETNLANFGVWWWPGDTLPYPSQLSGNTTSSTWSASLVHVFNSALTNETLLSWTDWLFPMKLANPKAVDPAAVGYTAAAPFNPAIAPQIPNILNWSCNTGSNSGCFPGYYAPSFPSNFQGGAFGNHKKAPGVQDNLTFVLRNHSMKFGGYWAESYQSQTNGYGDGQWGQGRFDFENYATYTTGNPIADLFLGHSAGYNQASATPVLNFNMYEYSLYAQDSWKIARRLTVNYGVRLNHEGQWTPTQGPGLAVWDASKYSDDPYAPLYTGMVWNGTDSSVPKSGFGNKQFNPDFRGGAAWDIRGDGSTVLRGGFGVYRWQFSLNDVGSALAPTLGVQVVNSPSVMKLAEAANYTPSAANMGNCQATASCGSYNVMKKDDNETPYTQNWNIIVSQKMPWSSMVEVEYSGNRTRNALFTGNGSAQNFIANINKIPLGALFGPDPKDGVNYYQQSCATADGCTVPQQNTGTLPVTLQDYRPYHNYGALNLIQHGSYSNYNALMFSWQKQAGRVTFLANYTWSKVMGIRDGQSNNGNGDGVTVDPFNIQNNYAPLAYDHTNIFNVAYVINFPSPMHGNFLLKGLINGWVASGTSQIQSGPPMQALTGGTMNVGYDVNGVTAGMQPVSNALIFGSDAPVLTPIITCDPGGGHGYFNPKCFSEPSVTKVQAAGFTPTNLGPHGQWVMPYFRGPAYSNHDLSVFKDFKFHDRNQVEFRVSGFNFLNHPLPQFGNNDVNLLLTSVAPGGVSTNTNATTTGSPKYKVCRRIMELALKYSF